MKNATAEVQNALQSADTTPSTVRRRGSHAFAARVSSADLSPGTRSVLARYVRAQVDNELYDHSSWTMRELDHAHQALLRKLLRLEGKLPPARQGRRHT